MNTNLSELAERNQQPPKAGSGQQFLPCPPVRSDRGGEWCCCCLLWQCTIPRIMEWSGLEGTLQDGLLGQTLHCVLLFLGSGQVLFLPFGHAGFRQPWAARLLWWPSPSLCVSPFCFPRVRDVALPAHSSPSSASCRGGIEGEGDNQLWHGPCAVL